MIEFGHNVDQIRKEQKSIFNRLKSIEEDALFIDQVAALYPELPLAANERCGSWYIDRTTHKVHSVYFKSTDGHAGIWDFNVRRGNFHILDLIAAYQGCIVVDSTRRGKRIPDALSKTIPIWCCVINRTIQQYHQRQQQQTLSNWDTTFYSLPSAVSRSEHAQIEARIDGFVQRMWDLGVDIDRIARLIKRPLRPFWLTPQSNLDHAIQCDDEYYPVLCVSASEYIQNGGCQARPAGYMYVQGSADDEEAWSMGLTCRLFWQHRDEILNDPRNCGQTVQTIVDQHRHQRTNNTTNTNDDDARQAHVIQGTTITIGNRAEATAHRNNSRTTSTYDAVIQCCYLVDPIPPTNQQQQQEQQQQGQPKVLDLAIPEGKKGQHVLEKAIAKAIEFARPFLASQQRILVYSVDGKDRAVGIALALLVHYYNKDKELELDGVKEVTKHSIKQKLIQVMASHPQAKPARVTLRRVNTHFLSPSATCLE
ncbi:tRNA A64-2'-O-ribosylphosphate transferase [Absidia repens]|uniref:tRNA A64-2'-O-ribosylphosphate transferase n=1 Tax=Absidia repens TaxID=90262 RepID=A0A1X2I8G5_9FUNG|nr:tRNA A64-2'-O-ribosylphosphate transferase [Absidia repens]